MCTQICSQKCSEFHKIISSVYYMHYIQFVVCILFNIFMYST